MNKHVDKKKVADSFLDSITTYELNSRVQKEEAEKLVTLCKSYLPPSFKRVLEVGCGTGLLTRKFISQFTVENLILADLSEEMCRNAGSQVQKNVKHTEFLIGDIEQHQLPNDCDLIISSSSLQWLSGLEVFLERCAKALIERGYLAFTLFGVGTMQEIRELTGRGLDYFSKDELVEIIRKKYTLECLEENTTELFFDSVKEIVAHIRNTGVGAINKKPMTVAQYKEFEKEYRRRFKTDKGFPLSYSSITVVARKK